jgi:hypothetical protein
MLGALVSNLWLLDREPYRALFLAQLGFYVVSLLAAYLPATQGIFKPLRLATMFTSMNAALLVGFWRWIGGTQNGTWVRTSRIDLSQDQSEVSSMARLPSGR